MFSPLAMEVKSQVLSIIAQPFSGCGAREAPTVPQSLSCASHGRKWDLGAYVFTVSFFFFWFCWEILSGVERGYFTHHEA